MNFKKTTLVILLFACVLLVQGATAIFDDYWNKTMSDDGWVPGPGNLFPDWNGTTPEFAPWPFGDRPEWNATPRFDFNDSAYERFSQRVLPDRNNTRSRYFFNDTPVRPGSGDRVLPGWNGTKPRFSFNDSSSWPFGNKVIPDGDRTKPGFFFNDSRVIPDSGTMMPGWNGRKPSVFSDDTGNGLQMGSRVLSV